MKKFSPIFYSKNRSVIEPIIGDEPILFVILPVTTGTMLNNKGLITRNRF